MRTFFAISLIVSALYVVCAETQQTKSDPDGLLKRDGSEEVGPIFFGHVHMAKTAGSSLNRLLARRYYGICGHKGYSYSQPLEDEIRHRFVDAVHHGGYDEDRVHWATMRALGYHNCALVSQEQYWRSWYMQIMNFYENATKVILLPCRDPIDHFLSKCNFVGVNATDLFSNQDCDASVACDQFEKRFDPRMLYRFHTAVLFSYDEFAGLTALLDSYLPKRVYPLPTKIKYTTNKERKSENEKFVGQCQIDTLRKRLIERFPYYQLCEGFHLNKTNKTVPTVLHDVYKHEEVTSTFRRFKHPHKFVEDPL